MRKNTKIIIALSFSLLFILTINACKKDKAAAGTDKELYDMAKETGGYTWFKNSSLLLNKSSGTGHPQTFIRTRYNAVAATKLDSSGKITTGALFPEGSLIVKELFDNATTLGRYAILYKKTGSVDADAKGWVWGYIDADGTVAEKASKKGSSCISCHSQPNNIDYMLMNKYFP
jgi:hypothetical protein